MVVKGPGQKHFTKDFGNGTVSDRVMLPGPDKSRVKVTRFMPKAGFETDGIVYKVDETVFVDEGNLKVCFDGITVHEINPGGMYYVPAGNSYALKVLTDSVLTCVFSPAENGTLPDDD